MSIQIAIDGPAGAGKSSIAKKLAKDLGYLYIDTGALYRAIGLFVFRKNICPKNEQQVADALAELSLKVAHQDGLQHLFLNNEDVSEAIREHRMSQYASDVSAIPAVRAFLLDFQRKLAKENNVIMDGRDIGTVILPHADVKIFLTASPQVRAARRCNELCAKGEPVAYDKVLRDMIARDNQDSTRTIAPLKAAEDAILADTSDFSFEESVVYLKKIIEENIHVL